MSSPGVPRLCADRFGRVWVWDPQRARYRWGDASCWQLRTLVSLRAYCGPLTAPPGWDDTVLVAVLLRDLSELTDERRSNEGCAAGA